MIISVTIGSTRQGPAVFPDQKPIDRTFNQLVGGPSCRRSNKEYRAQEMRFHP